MHTQLIVDFSDRTFFALAVTPEGQLLPCSQEVRQVATRYFSSEILFDPRPSEDPDFLWDEALEVLARGDARTLFQRARRLGLWRPWDVDAPADALRLPSPLAVLSSPAALVDPVVQPALPAVAISLLQALLVPLFSFLVQRGFALGETEAVVVIPAHTGRQARLALHKVFRRHGFRRLTLLSREVAAAMMELEQAPSEYLVWDVTGDDLHLHRVAAEPVEGRRRIRTLAARTVRGIGWPHWVRQIANALGGVPVPALDRALTGLLCGSHDSPELPGSPPLRLSHGLLDEVLGGESCPDLLPDLQARVRPHLDALDSQGLPVILLGAACGLGRLQDLFLSAAGGPQLPTAGQQPPLERAGRGVADALRWLRGGAGRTVELPPGGGLWLDTLRGELCGLLPAEHLPPAGEQGWLQRCFHFGGAADAAGPFLIHLLWGSDTSPEGNMNLCTLPLERGTSPEAERALWLTLHLRRSASGRRLGVTVEANLGRDGAQPSARMAFTQDFAEFSLER